MSEEGTVEWMQQRFLELSLEIHAHCQGGTFEELLKSYPSRKLHEWFGIGNILNGLVTKTP